MPLNLSLRLYKYLKCAYLKVICSAQHPSIAAKSQELPSPASVLIATLTLLICIQLIGCRQQVSTASNIVQESPEIAVDGPLENSSDTSTEASIIDNPQALENRWIVNANEAQQLIEQGATVLDARGGLFVKRLPGATIVDWRDFSSTEAVLRGTLITNDTVLSQKIQDLGVSNEKPVVVFGNPPSGWGEEGRIVWMLRSLGHTQAVMVDGGIQAMSEAGITIPSVTPATMTFTIERNRDWSIQKNQLKTQLASDNLIVIDSREPREFSGSTPYGEQRGGHIPGAVNLYFKDLLDADGKLLPKQTLLNRFESLDITPETTIVVYCTGGIRSGWLAAVLISLGLPAQNYAGSMWEWSASPADEYPLERQ